MQDQRLRLSSRVAIAVLIGLMLVSAAPVGALGDEPGGTTGGVIQKAGPQPADGQPTGRNIVAQQRSQYLAALRSSSVTSPASASLTIDQIFDVWEPGHTVLNTTVSGRIIEPHGAGFDDLHHSYTDANYWNFCVPGSTTVAAYYWISDAVLTRPGQNYVEPYGPRKTTTYWRSSDTGTSADTSNGYATKGRGFLMYMAEYTKPPAFSRPGIVDFTFYPSKGASVGDAALALNWEIFGNQNYFWQRKAVPGVSQTTFVNDVKSDLFDYGSPVLVALNTWINTTDRLPNWTRTVPHAVTIVGYDDATSMFTYVDTCGKACNGSAGNTNGGTHQVSYSRIYKLISNLGWGYAA